MKPHLFAVVVGLSVTVAGPALHAVDSATQPAQTAAPDPSMAIVAEGRFTYRQRDLDAFLLIAKRHAKYQATDADAEVLRQALARLFTAREDLLEALTALPPSYPPKARDALVLDLLDYQAESAKRPVTTAPAATVTVAAGTASPSADPVLIRLPPLTLNRTIAGAKHRLVLGLALHFRDPALAKRLESQAPLMQDAILSTTQRLPDAQFLNPDQFALKATLIQALRAVVSDFPADGILIPQLDSGDQAGDAKP